LKHERKLNTPFPQVTVYLESSEACLLACKEFPFHILKKKVASSEQEKGKTLLVGISRQSESFADAAAAFI